MAHVYNNKNKETRNEIGIIIRPIAIWHYRNSKVESNIICMQCNAMQCNTIQYGMVAKYKVHKTSFEVLTYTFAHYRIAGFLFLTPSRLLVAAPNVHVRRWHG